MKFSIILAKRHISVLAYPTYLKDRDRQINARKIGDCDIKIEETRVYYILSDRRSLEGDDKTNLNTLEEAA